MRPPSGGHSGSGSEKPWANRKVAQDSGLRVCPGSDGLVPIGSSSAPRTKRSMKLSTISSLLLTSAPVFASGTGGQDWPGWRGPEGTGISAESAWSSTAEEEPLWEKQLGLGHASFAVVGQHVYTLGFDETLELDTVYCLDVNTGEECWTHSYKANIWDLGHDGGASTTPTVVGDAVYTSNREGNVFCLDANTGKVRWHRTLAADMGIEPPKWGFSASPLPLDNSILLNYGKLIALDMETGANVWETEVDYGIAYSTPTLFELDGTGYIALLNGNGLAVLQADGGGEVDFFEWIKNPQVYPMTPVVIGDRIFISGGYDRGCVMLRLADGKLEELWGSRVMRNKMSGCVLWDDHLIGFDESILKCIDLDGNMKWRKRGLGTGSMSIAGDRMVILDGKGQLIVAEANTEEYVELSRKKIHEGGTSWSTPVLSHGRTFARSSFGQLVCLDNRLTETAPVATTTEPTGQTSLPPAATLVAGHVKAVRGTQSLSTVKSIHMAGPGESLRNTVEKGAIQLDWDPELGFSWRSEGGFHFTMLADTGWVSEMFGPKILSGEDLQTAQEGGAFERLFDPSTAYSELRTTEQTVFDNRPCYAVAAKSKTGQSRTIYFEVETGLFAGHQGEGVTMWTFANYKEFDGVLLPTKWAFYDPQNGEMNSAEFNEAAINVEPEEDPFEPPPTVKLILRTPEEIQADNERLTKEHADLLGEWKAIGAPDDAPKRTYSVADGFLVFTHPTRPPARMNAPSADGSLSMLGAEYVVFTPERDDDGTVTQIKVYVAGELEVTFVRP